MTYSIRLPSKRLMIIKAPVTGHRSFFCCRIGLTRRGSLRLVCVEVRNTKYKTQRHIRIIHKNAIDIRANA